MVLRFANGIFEPIWNRRYIDHVQITVAETLGVEGRGGYYDEAGRHPRHGAEPHDAAPHADGDGAARDVWRRRRARRKGEGAARHSTADRGRDRRRTPCAPSTDQGWSTAKHVPGYRQEDGVKPDSTTETYVALKLDIENWRWAGVPFYLRTGKRLPKRVTEIAIQFKRPPYLLFSRRRHRRDAAQRALAAHPAERRHLAALRRKVPGAEMQLRAVNMDSSMAAPSARSRRKPTSGCCSTACWAIRRSSRGSTRRSSPGNWWTPSCKGGSENTHPSRPTSRARGGPRRRTP